MVGRFWGGPSAQPEDVWRGPLAGGALTVAQGGAVLELRPLQSGNAGLPLGTYEPNEVATVELFTPSLQ